MIRLFIFAALSLVLQAWPVYCADDAGQPITLYVSQEQPPSPSQVTNICDTAGYTPMRQPTAYHYSVTCYDKQGAHTFELFSPSPLTIDAPTFCASRGMYAKGQRFGARFR